MKEEYKQLVKDTMQTLRDTFSQDSSLLVDDASAHFFGIRKAVQESFPDLPLATKIPDDAVAKESASSWKKYVVSTDVILLSFEESEEELLFFKNLAKAIHTHLKPTKILDAGRLEMEKKWDVFFEVNAPRLILVSEKALQSRSELKKFYKEATLTSPSQLGPFPLILLKPPLTYTEDKTEKQALWTALCQILKK